MRISKHGNIIIRVPVNQRYRQEFKNFGMWWCVSEWVDPNIPESWCLQNVTNHSHAPNNTTSHPTTYEVQISQINHMDGTISWTLSQQNAKIFETFIAGSGDCVAYCLQRKWCSIIRLTLYYQYLEIPQTLFHTLTSRIIWSLNFNMMWSGNLTHKTVTFKHEFSSFSVIRQLWKSIPLAS